MQHMDVGRQELTIGRVTVTKRWAINSTPELRRNRLEQLKDT